MSVTYTTTMFEFTASRKSAGHIAQQYTHAVWAGKPGLAWTCEAYASRLDLAQARAREFERMGYAVAIAPVTAEVKLTKRQREWLASR